ncbi:MAG: hypothetical protein QME64_09505 [bacterium]|nr:hypothetical protein [bacterium]
MPSSEHGIFENPKKSQYNYEKWDSRLEFEYMRRLEDDPRVIKWTKVHSINIPYQDDLGRRRAFHPDFLVELTTGIIEVHELKGKHMLNRETELKEHAGRIFCEKRKMKFRLYSK